MDDLLGTRNRWEIDMTGECKGFPRGYPANGTEEWDQYNEQAWPWQGIWPLHDHAAVTNHRVCNWVQENPVYEESHPPAKVKPQSSVLVQVQTNQHVHEYDQRPSGHYKVFLAGPSGTQLTTANQLTFDRVVFSAPANKYAHIWEQPTSGAQDPGNAWLPLKLVDPTGEYLPEGTYNFIFAYFWATAEKPQTDYMIPDYSSSFDIVISSESDADSGAITDCVTNNPKNCSQYLVGVSASPGAKDTTDPWPPYAGNYLYTNYDGDDPSTDNGKRTFQPYWTEFVPASKAPSITTGAPPNIAAKKDDPSLLDPIPVAGGAEMPGDILLYPNMTAGSGESMDVKRSEPKSLAAMGVATGGGSENMTSSASTANTNNDGSTQTSKARRHMRSFKVAGI
ncbi:uncharacterized protein KY384_003602 [Bacidia gigantensis]|uniref:uncharacterized protein n=1 Tax=Bacidia gigantensis TaxID=2732470 RepID=UPI001D042245|nr:uncharacterized protein KY384_003602 [Bacidia gigantensis]KAG8531966.1 hypothetical protein KY384_003602 [Bacidia gigantensis]